MTFFEIIIIYCFLSLVITYCKSTPVVLFGARSPFSEIHQYFEAKCYWYCYWLTKPILYIPIIFSVNCYFVVKWRSVKSPFIGWSKGHARDAHPIPFIINEFLANILSNWCPSLGLEPPRKSRIRHRFHIYFSSYAEYKLWKSFDLFGILVVFVLACEFRTRGRFPRVCTFYTRWIPFQRDAAWTVRFHFEKSVIWVFPNGIL